MYKYSINFMHSSGMLIRVVNNSGLDWIGYKLSFIGPHQAQ